MWLNASCFLEFHIPVPTPFLLMLRPRSGWQQWIAREEYVLSPSVPAVEFTDSFGNLCQRLVAPAGHFSVRTSVDIETCDWLGGSISTDVRTEKCPAGATSRWQRLPNESVNSTAGTLGDNTYSSRAIHCCHPLRGRSMSKNGVGTGI